MTEITKEDLEKLLPLKRSKSFYAGRLGVSEEKVADLLDEIRGIGKEVEVEEEENTTVKEYSKKEDFSKEKISVSGIWDHPPTPEEVIESHKIDITKWRLAQLWVKQKSTGFVTSADFIPLKPNEIDPISIKEVLSEVFSKGKEESQYITNYTPLKKKRGLFVYMSDKHIGALTKPEAMFGNEYNGRVFKERMTLLVYEIQRLADQFGKFEDIYLMDLGDSLDGYNGYTTRADHKLPQNMNNKEAFMTYLQVHKEFFDTLYRLSVANQYHFVAQTNDNHSGDFGYIANQAVIEYLNVKYPGVETRIMEKFIEHFQYGEDHTFLICHGKDTEDLRFPLPLNLNEKTENYIRKYIDYQSIKTNKVHFVKGDLHQDASQTTYGFRYKNVLSMYGTSKWMHTNFGPNFPGVSVDIVDKEGPGVFEYKIEF